MSDEQAEIEAIRYHLVWTDELAKKVFSAREPRRLKSQANTWRAWFTGAVLALVVIGGGVVYGAVVDRPGATAGFMLGSGVTLLLMHSVLGRLSRNELLTRHRRWAADGTEEMITLSSNGVNIRSRKGESSLSWSVFPFISTENWGVILWTAYGQRVPLPTNAQTDELDHDTISTLIGKWSTPQ